MIYVLFRSAADATLDKQGQAWQRNIGPYEVDETIHPHGGIILKEVKLSSPVMFEHGTVPDGEGKVVRTTVKHEMKVIRKEKGDSGADVFVCEPCEYLAKYICEKRIDWRYAGYKRLDDVPHIVSAAPAAPAEPAKKE